MIARSLTTAVATLLVASTASSQACVGRPSFGAGAIEVAAGGAFDDARSAASAAVAAGTAGNGYGSVGYARTSDRNTGVATNAVLLEAGLERAWPRSRNADSARVGHRFAACPIVHAEFETGFRWEEELFRYDARVRRIGGGLTMGSRIPVAPRRFLTPFVAAIYVHESAEIDRITKQLPSTSTRTEFDDYTVATVGLALELGRVALRVAGDRALGRLEARSTIRGGVVLRFRAPYNTAG